MLAPITLLVLAGLAVTGWWHFRVEAPIRVAGLGPYNYDDFTYAYPTFRYGFDEIRAGRFPFWNPYQHCGTPFFATAQHLLLYPLNVLFLLFPAAIAMKGTALLHLTLGFVFTFFLARVLALSVIGAAAAAVVFTFSPSLTILISMPHFLYGAVWVPLQLALVHLLLSRAKPLLWGATLGVTLAAQYLGGYPMYTLFSLYVVWGYFGWRVLTHGSGRTRFAAARGSALIVATGLAAALSAPQLLPALELSHLSPRSVAALSLEQADPAYGLVPRHPLRLLLGSVLPSRDAQAYMGYANIGPFAWALAGLAVLHRRFRGLVAFSGALTIVSALLALGRHTPLFALYFFLPTGQLFRLPDRFLFLTVVGLALLTGIAVDYLWRAARREFEVPRSLFSAVIALLLTAALASKLELLESIRDVVRPAALLEHIRLLRLYLIVSAVWLGAYLIVPRWRRWLTALSPLAIYASLFLMYRNTAALPETHPDLHTLPTEVAAFLQGEQGHDRTYVALPTSLAVPNKAGMLHRLYTIGDRETIFPVRIARYTERMRPPIDPVVADLLARAQVIPQGEFIVSSRSPNLRLFDLMGAKFIVEGPDARFRQPEDAARFPLVHQSRGVHVYRNPLAYPRAFLVTAAEVIPDPERLLDRLTDSSFDPLRAVLLEERPPDLPPTVPLPTDVSARIVAYDAHRAEIECAAPSGAVLVLTDQYYPGWLATVDDEPVSIYRANYLFRAVLVPAGTHRVVFRFVPSTFNRGIAIAVAAAASVLAAVWSVGRRGARAERRLLGRL